MSLNHRALVTAMLLACAVPACVAPQREATPSSILLFAGQGTSPNDVAALQGILSDRGLSYSPVTSERLNGLREQDLAAYRLLLMPGGNFEQMGNGLTAEAMGRIRGAVRGGVSYLGICAGAFIAGASPYNGLDLTAGVRFPFYALEDRGIRKAAVAISTADRAPLDLYWEDGPQLTGWGEAVARYPDGTPAVVQGSYGAGWVVLAGVHPEAPENWRGGMSFRTSAREGQAYAATLIDAALNRRRLTAH